MGELTELLSTFDLTWRHVLAALVASIALVVVSVVLVLALLVRLPSNYFHSSHPRMLLNGYPPAVRWMALIAKNLLGVVVLLWGIALLLPGVPGQGVLTIFVGLMLLDFPGKRGFERQIVRRRAVLRAINGLRKRFARPPLVID